MNMFWIAAGRHSIPVLLVSGWQCTMSALGSVQFSYCTGVEAVLKSVCP